MYEQLNQSTVLQVRTPVALASAIKTAAERDLTTASEYVRQAVIGRLREDGFLTAKLSRGPE